MGFWSGFMKVMQGKPVFEAPAGGQRAEEPATPVAETASTVVDSAGRKIIPEVQIDHCKSHIDGTEMTVTAWMTNRSEVEIELDKIIIAGATMEIDRILSPQEGREARIYKGSAPTDDRHHTANLRYKRRDNGDYFQADFRVEYHRDSQGFYEIEELHSIRPIRDI